MPRGRGPRLAHLPAEYQAIETHAQLTRGDLAALIGIRLPALVQAARQKDAVRRHRCPQHWASTWIVGVARAGVMEPSPTTRSSRAGSCGGPISRSR